MQKGGRGGKVGKMGADVGRGGWYAGVLVLKVD
jgi:hypothetical protein